MKRPFFLLMTLVWVHILSAQGYGMLSGLTYYMPANMIVINVEYTRTIEHPGKFYQYSERYLGTSDVVREEIVRYEITDIGLSLATKADTARAYTLPLDDKAFADYEIYLTDKRLLQTINREPEDKQAKTKSAIQEEQTGQMQSSVMPLLEEQMLANSLNKMAEGTAKLIYRLRETRLNILAGDVEHVPADGRAMELVLQTLREEEERLTALFVGERKTERLMYKLYIAPDSDLQEEVVMRFSRFSGPVDKDDLSGEPVYMTLQGCRQETLQEGKRGQIGIFYNQPGSAEVSVTYNGMKYAEREFTIAQFGTSIPLPTSIYTGKKKKAVVFDTRSGAVISISK